MVQAINRLELSQKILSPTIKLLGEILGEVITEQMGEEALDLEEEVRLLAKQYREEDDTSALKSLKNKLQGLDPSDFKTLIKAFSLFFQLTNLAEEDYQIHINEILKESGELENNIADTISFVLSHNLQLADLLTILRNIRFKLVWTAHPTEARRLTNLIKLREIYQLIDRLEHTNTTSRAYHDLRRKIKEKIVILWQSDDLREDKVKVLDEIRTNLFYFENTIFEVLPDIYKEIITCIKSRYNVIVNEPLPIFVEFGSWVGGDRDGHPGVDARITYQALLLQKRLCLRKYLETIKQLIRDLSSSLNEVNVDQELLHEIEKDSAVFSDFASKTSRLNRLEPYRRKLDFIRLRLENTLLEVEENAVSIGLGRTLVGYSESSITRDTETYYHRSSELLRELQILDKSLRNHSGSIIADGQLSDLILKVQVFGFHLAPLEIRQHSKVHDQALQSIFSLISDKDVSLKRIVNELSNPRPLGTKYFINKCDQQTQELFKTLEVVYKSLKDISPRAIESYIISMTRDEKDIFTLMLLFKEAGLLSMDRGSVIDCALDIVPLFETKEDLMNAPAVMRRLFINPIYRSYLEARGNIQEIMIGYSDSTKDVGFFQSNYRLYTAQLELVQIAQDHGISLQIFHGRGGSISRGGGPTYQSILAQPTGSLYRTKITEQGEVIAYTYANPRIAFRHLEQIVSAMITRSIQDTEMNKTIPRRYMDAFKMIADVACQTYETMVKDSREFIEFYMQFTPLDLIETATIGSRPSRRTIGVVDQIDDLRAIPWIFSWMQTRIIFTTYYGVGSGFDHYVKNYGIDLLKEMYREWSYFQMLVDNLHMICLKVDLGIAREYRTLVSDQYFGIFDKIKDEFELTSKYLLEISEMKNFMENKPDKRNSILRRNPYIDPLSLMQVDLLKRWRSTGRPETSDSEGLQKLLLKTVNGIAAGLRNTG